MHGRRTWTGVLASKGLKAGEKRVGESLRIVSSLYSQARRHPVARMTNPGTYQADYFGQKLHIDQNKKNVMFGVMHICDRISHNKASTHTKSNLRFYQKWIADLIHYHISHCTSFSTDKSGFCSSFLPTLSKPRV